ncbi:MAG: helix-turn-helix transcriptional regulator, partial [Parvibaculaceae bacterium]|nr:helix-turn-helix transcriptional regulator [Parvibaculaceae bacterium]
RGIQEDIRLYILDSLSSDLSLDYLEKTFALSRRSIQRKFKQAYGIGLGNFIRTERLKLANQALQHDGATIAQAAHLACYSSTTNFSTAFRKHFGISPSTIQNSAL